MAKDENHWLRRQLVVLSWEKWMTREQLSAPAVPSLPGRGTWFSFISDCTSERVQIPCLYLSVISGTSLLSSVQYAMSWEVLLSFILVFDILMVLQLHFWTLSPNFTCLSLPDASPADLFVKSGLCSPCPKPSAESCFKQVEPARITVGSPSKSSQPGHSCCWHLSSWIWAP